MRTRFLIPIFALSACATPADLRARAPDHTRTITAPPAEVAACITAAWEAAPLIPTIALRPAPHGGVSVSNLGGAGDTLLLVDLLPGTMKVYLARSYLFSDRLVAGAVSCANPQ